MDKTHERCNHYFNTMVCVIKQGKLYPVCIGIQRGIVEGRIGKRKKADQHPVGLL